MQDFTDSIDDGVREVFRSWNLRSNPGVASRPRQQFSSVLSNARRCSRHRFLLPKLAAFRCREGAGGRRLIPVVTCLRVACAVSIRRWVLLGATQSFTSNKHSFPIRLRYGVAVCRSGFCHVPAVEISIPVPCLFAVGPISSSVTC